MFLEERAEDDFEVHTGKERKACLVENDGARRLSFYDFKYQRLHYLLEDLVL